MNKNKAYAPVSYQHAWLSLCGHGTQCTVSVSSQGCALGDNVYKGRFWQKIPDVSWIRLRINSEVE